MAAGAAAAFAPGMLKADNSTMNVPTPAPAASQVQTHLRLDLKEDVKEVHFVNTNNDPYVYTKVYFLKNADPYELRPYLIGAVGGYWDTANAYTTTSLQGRRINDNPTKVDCIKYMDGVGALIVSAEDYRFKPNGNENGMSIDEIVSILDQPKITSSSAQVFTLYFPKYQTAAELSTAINRVGLNGNTVVAGVAGTGNQWELDQGKDRVRTDSYLNALLFYTPAYSIKSFQEMLAQYDKPNPEVHVNYTIYEYDREIDSQIGNDFQAWKNGPGADLFSVAGRFTNGWDISNMNVARNYGIDNNAAKYFNFNPKWNTKYLDLLAAKSQAKVLTSGSLSIFNNKVGSVMSTIQYPTIIDGTTPTSTGITAVSTTTFTTTSTTASGLVDRNGVAITGVTNGVSINAAKYAFTQINGNGTAVTDYFYEFQLPDGAGMTNANGQGLGTDVVCMATTPFTSLTAITVGAVALQTTATTTFVTSSNFEPTAFPMQKAPTRVTSIASLGTNSTDYGFQLTIGATANGNAPVLTVCETTTTVPITMVNTNLIGFTSNGAPRTSQSRVSTVVVVSNKGEKFVVGGLDKEQVIRSANKVPYLGDIPGLGWALGNERETHKKSQIVGVFEVVPVIPETTVPANVMTQIAKDKEFIGNYGVKGEIFDENDYGFDQFLLDSDKKSFEPLP